MIHHHGQNDNIHNQFTSRKRREYSQCNVPRVPASVYDFWLPNFSVRVFVCVIYIGEWFVLQLLTTVRDSTNAQKRLRVSCVQHFQMRLLASLPSGISLRRGHGLLKTTFKNNLPSKGIPVCTKGEEDPLRWYSSLTQLYITKSSCFIPQLPVST